MKSTKGTYVCLQKRRNENKWRASQAELVLVAQLALL